MEGGAWGEFAGGLGCCDLWGWALGLRGWGAVVAAGLGLACGVVALLTVGALYYDGRYYMTDVLL
ncbi:MAG: hypothetical protein Hals2KO_04990 [Halioglobus sp.]